MASDDYRFVTTWRLKGMAGEVADVIGAPLELPRWWPSVYLDAWQIRPPDEKGLHQRIGVHTKGWLPYELRWEFELLESDYPRRFRIEARGDLAGEGVWMFVQQGDVVDVTYEWTVRARKRLLRGLGPLLRRLFEANHRWAMARGLESLELELARRRATNDEAKRAVPMPPAPVTLTGVGLLAGIVAVVGGLGWLVWRAARRPRRDAGSGLEQ